MTEPELEHKNSDLTVSSSRHASIEATYRENADVLMRLAVGLVGPNNAEDLVATAVAKSLRSRTGQLDDPLAYLYRAVVNEGTSFFRRAGVRSRAFKPVDSAAHRSAPDHSDGVVGGIEVRRAMSSLPARQRAVCVLTYWEDKPITEVAELMDISEGSVKKHLARARASLRKGLES